MLYHLRKLRRLCFLSHPARHREKLTYYRWAASVSRVLSGVKSARATKAVLSTVRVLLAPVDEACRPPTYAPHDRNNGLREGRWLPI